MGMKSAWVRLALVCVAAVVAAIAVAGGTAGNGQRNGQPKFDAVPGPGRVTYGENIAYRAAFTNTGSSTFQKVTFRMRYPYIEKGTEPYQQAAAPIDDTCPTAPTTVTLSNGYKEWACTFGSLTPGTPGAEQLVVSVVWTVPTPPDPSVNCPTGLPANQPGCLVSNGRWTVNEGVNDQSDPNDAFPPGGKDVRAVMLAAGAQSQELQEAGGYELPNNCTDPLDQGSLRTKQVVSLANPVSTTVCLPNFETDKTPNDGKPAVDLGLATTIVEENLDDPNPAGHGLLGRSRICIADLGVNCTADELYTPFAFTLEKPVKLVFRISSDAIAALYKNNQTISKDITQVFHDGVALPLCPAAPPAPNQLKGCYTSIKENKQGPNKFWVIEAQAPGNGLWGW
jgi:hypothetical protein